MLYRVAVSSAAPAIGKPTLMNSSTLLRATNRGRFEYGAMAAKCLFNPLL